MTNEEMFQEFLDNKHNLEALRRYCQRYIKSEEAAEDIAQDALLRMFNSLHKYDSKRATIKTVTMWFVRTLALNYLRDNPNPNRFDVFDDIHNSMFVAPDNPLDILVKEETNELLNKLIDKLPEEKRNKLREYHFESEGERKNRGQDFYRANQRSRQKLKGIIQRRYLENFT